MENNDFFSAVAKITTLRFELALTLRIDENEKGQNSVFRLIRTGMKIVI